jgi:hypothetical protein
MSARYNPENDIDLPLPTAIWVLSAHVFALLMPLLLIAAVTHHSTELSALTDYPVLFYVAAGFMMAGSAFEIAQNAIDRWYLTPEAGSANGTGFCDMLFYACIVASQGLVAVACMGDRIWVPLLTIAMTALFPFLYLRQFAQSLPLAVLGLLAAVTAWLQLGEPIVLLQLLLVPLTLYFFGGLLQTGNQALHGFTTLAASGGVLFLVWGIHAAATGASPGWVGVIAAAIAVALVALTLRPWVYSLPPTPRRMV